MTVLPVACLLGEQDDPYRRAGRGEPGLRRLRYPEEADLRRPRHDAEQERRERRPQREQPCREARLDARTSVIAPAVLPERLGRRRREAAKRARRPTAETAAVAIACATTMHAIACQTRRTACRSRSPRSRRPIEKRQLARRAGRSGRGGVARSTRRSRAPARAGQRRGEDRRPPARSCRTRCSANGAKATRTTAPEGAADELEAERHLEQPPQPSPVLRGDVAEAELRQ